MQTLILYRESLEGDCLWVRPVSRDDIPLFEFVSGGSIAVKSAHFYEKVMPVIRALNWGVRQIHD